MTLMHCISQYPACVSGCNLLTLVDMAKYNHPVGLSDHTVSTVVPSWSIMLGVVMIEKHVKLTEDCLDAAFSITPAQSTEMVSLCEMAKLAMGNIHYAGDGPYKRREIDGVMLRIVE